MDDAQIHGTIEQLVTEEHELWQRESAGEASDADRMRLGELKVSLGNGTGGFTCGSDGPQ